MRVGPTYPSQNDGWVDVSKLLLVTGHLERAPTYLIRGIVSLSQVRVRVFWASGFDSAHGPLWDRARNLFTAVRGIPLKSACFTFLKVSEAPVEKWRRCGHLR